MSYPQRVVCLAAEVPEIINALGAFSSVVGVSGFTRHPAAARKLPKVGGFSDAILQTGPSILTGARQLAVLIHAHAREEARV